MVVNRQKLVLLVVVSLAFGLTACSSMYYERPQAHSLPKLPEISRPSRSKVYPKPKVAVSKPRVATARVSKYSQSASSKSQITSIVTLKRKDTLTSNVSNVESMEQNNEQIDPYASIPDSGINEVSTSTTQKPIATREEGSPAVKSLLIRAQADLSIGQTTSAVSKLERALRIEPQNAKLWNLLATAHYDQSDYQQSITMAKKSIRYSGDDDLIAKNWALIKKSGLQSGDTIVVKEANNYIKLNP